LEGVLGVMVVVENTTTDAPDHRAVPTHQSFDGRRITAPDEALQELPVGLFASGLQKGDSVNVLDDLVHLRRHQVPSSADGNGRPLPLYYPQEGGLMHDFLLVCGICWALILVPKRGLGTRIKPAQKPKPFAPIVRRVEEVVLKKLIPKLKPTPFSPPSQ
jgi:hypothetical protein